MKWRLGILILALSWSVPVWAAQNVVNTVHNLSISGPGPFKSLTINRVCVFCHTPHNALPHSPLWNRRDSGQTYLEYGSTTMDAAPGQPTGKSRLCLACHDGTVALGAMLNPPVNNDMLETLLSGRGNLTTDLRDDHPISFQYDAALQAADQQLVHPAGIDLPLENGELQCTTCHDPHEAEIIPFLRKAAVNGELCITCHDKLGTTWNWTSSSHATSQATPRGLTPWPERKASWPKFSTVAQGGCLNCHTPHAATTPIRLIKGDVTLLPGIAGEEHTCYLCHNGTVAATDIRAEFAKFRIHPVDITPNPDHDAALVESPSTMPFHVECADCHNPHAVAAAPPMISFNPSSPFDPNHSIPPNANAKIAGVSGVDINGGNKENIDFEYELCFKCHGVSGRSACDRGRCSTATANTMYRLDGVYNIRDRVNSGTPGLVSYHPIETNNPSNNSEVPSLRTNIPLNRTSSLIYCADCHSGDMSPAAGGASPSGAHGSDNDALLAQRYRIDPTRNQGAAEYDLCYKCHDESRLLNDVSGFPHKEHVRSHGAPCIVCHDPHGANSTHLVNFMTSANGSPVVSAISGESAPRWQDDGVYRGRCFLVCHGKTHNPLIYPD